MYATDNDGFDALVAARLEFIGRAEPLIRKVQASSRRFLQNTRARRAKEARVRRRRDQGLAVAGVAALVLCIVAALRGGRYAALTSKAAPVWESGKARAAPLVEKVADGAELLCNKVSS